MNPSGKDSLTLGEDENGRYISLVDEDKFEKKYYFDAGSHFARLVECVHQGRVQTTMGYRLESRPPTTALTGVSDADKMGLLLSQVEVGTDELDDGALFTRSFRLARQMDEGDLYVITLGVLKPLKTPWEFDNAHPDSFARKNHDELSSIWWEADFAPKSVFIQDKESVLRTLLNAKAVRDSLSKADTHSDPKSVVLTGEVDAQLRSSSHVDIDRADPTTREALSLLQGGVPCVIQIALLSLGKAAE